MANAGSGVNEGAAPRLIVVQESLIARDWLAAAVLVGLGALSRSAMLIVAAALASGLALERAWPVRR
jgi:hypothetical protein